MLQLQATGRVPRVRDFERDGRKFFFASLETVDDRGDRAVLPFRSELSLTAAERVTVTLGVSSYQKAKAYTGRDGSARAVIEDVVVFDLIKIEPAK